MSDFTEDQLAAVKKAYANGVKTVQHDGKTVTYRSLGEMERVIQRMESELGKAPRRELRRIGTSRGFR